MADVLVVEDDDDVALLISMFLEQEGHLVRRARDGEQALALVDQRLPEVLVMDVEMPLLDGPGVAARMLVQDAGREQIPIVLVSGAVDLAAVADRLGTPYVLAKPFDPAIMLTLVARAVVEGQAPCPRFPKRARVSEA